MKGYVIQHVQSQRYVKVESKLYGDGSQKVDCHALNSEDATIFAINDIRFDDSVQVRGTPDLLRTKGNYGFQSTYEGNLYAFRNTDRGQQWMTFDTKWAKFEKTYNPGPNQKFQLASKVKNNERYFNIMSSDGKSTLDCSKSKSYC